MFKRFSNFGIAVLALCFVFAQTTCLRAQSDPIAYWRFEEGSGSFVADSSGNGNDGTIYGAAWTSDVPSSALGDWAVYFDGLDDYVDCGDILMPVDQVTISFWLKLNSVEHEADLVGKEMCCKIFINDARQIRFQLSNGGWHTSLGASEPLSLDTWYHVACTYDGNLAKIYINSGKEAETAETGSQNDNSSSFKIGAVWNNPPWFSNTTIDEVKVYDYALTAEQIAEDMESNRLVALWHFEEGSGNSVADSSGSGNDGTIYGAAWTNDVPSSALGDWAIYFDGVDDYVDVPDNYTLALDSLTIEAWINTNTSIYSVFIIKQGTFNQNLYNIALTAEGLANGAVRGELSSDRTDVYSSTRVNDGEWHHIAFVRDTATQEAKIYIDGVLEDSAVDISQGTVDNDGDLIIGAGKEGIRERFDGIIDEVKIYNYARTAEEIAEDAEVAPEPPEMFDDTMSPTGAIHAYQKLIWPPKGKCSHGGHNIFWPFIGRKVNMTLTGYVVDEMSIARDGAGIGVSYAYILVNDTEIILRDDTTDLLEEDGSFNINVPIKADRRGVYKVELYADDTEPEEDGGPNSGLVDSTYISIPYNMSHNRWW